MNTQKFPRLAFVDLETTGATTGRDRITEVGIIEVDEHEVREWSSLVNPEMPIPNFIQSLTGITDEMVQVAPTFSELADDIAARLDNRIFVAHNASFDYRFLKQEFRRIGLDFHPQVLCTVKLSRKLFPSFERHNLDSLVQRHSLQVTSRHRALGDARLIWQFWQKIHGLHGPERIKEVMALLLARPSIRSRTEELRIGDIPETQGVYVLYDDTDTALHVGKSENLRKHLAARFDREHMSLQEQQLAMETDRIEWVEIPGPLGSTLLEAVMNREKMPADGNHSQNKQDACAWRLLPGKHGVLSVTLAFSDDLFFGYDYQLYGPYATPQKANEALRAIATRHGLCHALLGIEKLRPGRPCTSRRAGTCHGACIGLESIEAHNARVIDALQPQRLEPWPFPGPIGIRENKTMHVIHGWTYLGSANNDEDIALLLQKGQQRFDREVYRILRKWLPKMRENISLL